MATAPTNPAIPMPDGEELEDDEREAGDEQEVRDPRRPERVRELLTEVELVEADLLVRLAPPGVALADHVGRVERDLLAVDRDRLSVERNDEIADRRLHRVDDVESLGVLGRQPTIDDRRDVLGAAIVGGLASRTCVRPRAASGPNVVEVAPDAPDRCPRPARPRRSAR